MRSHADAFPDKLALSDGEVALSFKTVDIFGDWFARKLLRMGLKKADGVFMVAPRQAIAGACILGVFRAGGVHIPVDARMPDKRLEYIVRDKEPKVVILEHDQEERLRKLIPRGEFVFVEDLIKQAEAWEQLAPTAPSDIAPDNNVLPDDTMLADDTAYCIYTSGSTGRPKGVLISFASINHFFVATAKVYDVRSSSRCASFSPMHFDVYLMDMLFPLHQGASLHLFLGVVTPDPALELIQREKLTHFSAWGMMLGLISQAGAFGREMPDIETILTGTDVPDVKAVQNWLRVNDRLKVINAYGPTEVTCAAVAYVIKEREPSRKELYPIGDALCGVSTVLIDHEGQVIERSGVAGELLLGGAQVMQGYLNLPDETAARLSDRDGVTFYRTGDVCEWDPEGGYRYLGRQDNEVSLGGYRVHLHEVERVINSVDGVHGSVVTPVTSRIGENVLAASVLMDKLRAPEGNGQVAAIRRRLADELPGYMVPRHVFITAEFPSLASGKPDRNRLSTLLQDRVASKWRKAES